MPDNLVFLAIEFSLTKLYVNSFLAMLNARQGIRERSDDGLSVNMSNLQSGVGYPGPAALSFTATTDSVKKNLSPITLLGPDAANEKGTPVFSWTIPEEPEEV